MSQILRSAWEGAVGTDQPGQGRNSPHLPVESFLIRGNDFQIAGCEEVFVMSAPHTHSQVELNYVLEGRMVYRHDGRVATLQAGDLGLLWGAIPHQSVEVAPGTRYVCIYLPLEMFLGADIGEGLRSAVLAGGMVVAAEPRRFEPQAMRRMRAEWLASADRRLRDLVAAEVVLLLRRLDITGWRDLLSGSHEEGRAVSGAMPPKVLEMTRFIAEHGHEAITVADVARAAMLHPNYAMTRFRALLGMTVAHYILRHRMMAAQTLLLSTRKDLATIAFETGFGSVSQFHRSFRSYFACTPASFRRHMRPVQRLALPGGR
jgi:AraC-like DNA-binding protein